MVPGIISFHTPGYIHVLNLKVGLGICSFRIGKLELASGILYIPVISIYLASLHHKLLIFKPSKGPHLINRDTSPK